MRLIKTLMSTLGLSFRLLLSILKFVLAKIKTVLNIFFRMAIPAEMRENAFAIFFIAILGLGIGLYTFGFAPVKVVLSVIVGAYSFWGFSRIIDMFAKVPSLVSRGAARIHKPSAFKIRSTKRLEDSTEDDDQQKQEEELARLYMKSQD